MILKLFVPLKFRQLKSSVDNKTDLSWYNLSTEVRY